MICLPAFAEVVMKTIKKIHSEYIPISLYFAEPIFAYDSPSNNIIIKPFEANNNGRNKVLELIMEMHIVMGKCYGFAI